MTFILYLIQDIEDKRVFKRIGSISLIAARWPAMAGIEIDVEQQTIVIQFHFAQLCNPFDGLEVLNLRVM